MAYAGRLRRFDPIAQKFIGSWAWPEPGTVLPSANQAMYTDRNGMLWVGTPAGLRLFDPKSGQWMSLRHDPTDRYSLSANDVLSVIGDREGNLWVGVKGAGVNRFSPEQMRFGAWRRDPSDPDGLSDSNVRAIYKDRSGVVWMGTYSGGLNSFEPGSGKFRHYRHNPKDPHSLNNDQVLSIYEDKAGTLWIGTDAGVNRLNRNTGTFDRFKRNGPGNRTYTFLEDKKGRFWVGGGSTYRALLDRQNRHTHASGYCHRGRPFHL